MIDQSEIEKHLRRFIQENFLIDKNVMKEISNDDNLPEKGIIDSFGIMEVIRHVEGEYGLSFEETDITLDNLASIKAIAAFILRKKKND